MIWLTFLATLAVLCAVATNLHPLLTTTTASLLGALLGLLAAIVVSGLLQVQCSPVSLPWPTHKWPQYSAATWSLCLFFFSPSPCSPHIHTAGSLLPRLFSRPALRSCLLYCSYTPRKGLQCQAWRTASGCTSVRKTAVLATNRTVIVMVTITYSAGSFCSWQVLCCPFTQSGPPFLDSIHPVCVIYMLS